MIQAWMDMVPMVPMVPTAWQSKVISRFRDCILMEKQVASRLDSDISEGIKCLLNKDWTSRTKYQWVDKLHNSYHIGWVPLLPAVSAAFKAYKKMSAKKQQDKIQVLLTWPHQEAAWPVQLDGSVPRVFEPRESGEAWASDLGYWCKGKLLIKVAKVFDHQGF